MRGSRGSGRRHGGRWAVPFLVCLAALLAPSAVLAQNPLYLPDAQQQAWAGRLAAAQQDIAEARERVAELEAAYSQARHSQHPRGDEREVLQEKLVDAKSELEQAEQRLPELVEQARQAGVYPAILRPYQGD